MIFITTIYISPNIGHIRANVNRLGNNDGMADNADMYDHGPELMGLLAARVDYEPLIFDGADRNFKMSAQVRARYDAEIHYQLQRHKAKFQNDNRIFIPGEDAYDPTASTEYFRGDGGVRVTDWEERKARLSVKVEGFTKLQRESYDAAVKFISSDNKADDWEPLRMFLSGEGGVF